MKLAKIYKTSIQYGAIFFLGFVTYWFFFDYNHVQPEISATSTTDFHIPTEEHSFDASLSKGFGADSNKDYVASSLQAAKSTTPVSIAQKIQTLLEQQTHSALRKTKIDLLVGEWAIQSPVAALDFLMDEQLTDHVMTVLELAGQQGDEHVLSWLNGQTNQAETVYWFDRYFRSMARHEPATALEYVLQHEDSQTKGSLRTSIVHEWSKVDAPAALIWVQTAELNQTQKAGLQKVILSQYAEKSPLRASQYISSLVNEDDQRELVAQIALLMSTNDFSQTMSWADTLPEHLYQHAMSSALGNWVVSSDPVVVINYLSSRADQLHQQSLFNNNVSRVASRAPALLLSKLNEFPEQTQSLVIREATKALSKSENADPSALISRLDSPTLQDLAWEGLTNYTAQRDPRTAFTHAKNIVNNGQRKHYLTMVVRKWGQLNKDEAQRAIIASNEWTNREKDALISNLNVVD